MARPRVFGSTTSSARPFLSCLRFVGQRSFEINWSQYLCCNPLVHSMLDFVKESSDAGAHDGCRRIQGCAEALLEEMRWDAALSGTHAEEPSGE